MAANKVDKQSLFEACKKNDVVLIQKFLDDATSHLSLVRNSEKQNLLHAACMDGAEDVLEMMLKYPKVMQKINSFDRQKRTALHLAAAMGYTAVVKRLLMLGLELDAQDRHGATPLFLAVQFEWPEAAKLMLEAEANPLIEDFHGINAVDKANEKDEGNFALMLKSFQGQRETTTFQALKDLFFPRQIPRPDPHPDVENKRAVSPQRIGRSRSEDHLLGSSPGTTPASSPVKIDPLGNALAEAVQLVTETKATGATEATEQQQQKNQQGFKPKLVDSTGKVINKGQFAPGAKGKNGAKEKPAAAASGSSEGTDVFRLHAFFDQQVERLGFEVEWHPACPIAGVVKPEGSAERRGVVRGDMIVEISGVSTAGKGREELLPLMKKRPLAIKVDRTTQVHTQPQPHAQFTILLNENAFSSHGLEVNCKQAMPVVSAVHENTKGWAAGVLEGDALLAADGQDLSKASQSAVKSALEAAGSVTVRRRPLSVQSSAPWGA